MLIDAENIGPRHIESVLESIERLKLGLVVERRMYGDFENPQLAAWIEKGEALGITRVQNDANTRNAADHRLMMDAMVLMLTLEPAGFCLVSCDRDLTSLARRLRREGLAVYGFGMRHTSKVFQRACTRFFRIDGVPINRRPKPPEPPRLGMVVRAWN